ncbi:MAG: M48 family metalloprotease [Microscillaceae bacterium]|nr:M48 family metalloprotease [Microscillaceae bacterium]MDW8460402.1 M48 family metalloprotease [Cytophagales bacterium]
MIQTSLAKIRIAIALLIVLTMIGCLPSANTSGTQRGGFNLMSLQDDIRLGQRTRDEIARNPQQFPILSERQFPDAYRHLRRITDAILNTGMIQYRNQFAWELYIIRDDNTLNAFVTPGGYIYVYTGLIKYLDTEDQLAGVMGHEIAHADRRHSTTNLTKKYGLEVLTSLILGETTHNTSLMGSLVRDLAGVGTGLASLSFSREAERDADEHSVYYLAKTNYQCNGAAGFFEKILASGKAGKTPVFLSTHPSSDSRVADINKTAAKIGCQAKPSTIDSYQAFKRSLP